MSTRPSLTLYALGAALLVLSMPVIRPAFAIDTGGDRNRDQAPGTKDVSPKIRAPEPYPNHEVWRLGVKTEFLDVGERIREVISGSPAARAGFEPGDVIITVNGYQVGRLGDRVYPLEDELQRRANARGEVRLLVQDVRTSRILNADIRLDRGPIRAREAVIRGEVTYRDPLNLVPGSDLRIELVHRTPFSKDTVHRQTWQNIGQSPVPFEFRYPLENIRPNETYEILAEIRRRDVRLFVLDRPYRIRAGVDESGVQLSLRRN